MLSSVASPSWSTVHTPADSHKHLGGCVSHRTLEPRADAGLRLTGAATFADPSVKCRYGARSVNSTRRAALHVLARIMTETGHRASRSAFRFVSVNGAAAILWVITVPEEEMGAAGFEPATSRV